MSHIEEWGKLLAGLAALAVVFWGAILLLIGWIFGWKVVLILIGAAFLFVFSFFIKDVTAPTPRQPVGEIRELREPQPESKKPRIISDEEKEKLVNDSVTLHMGTNIYPEEE